MEVLAFIVGRDFDACHSAKVAVLVKIKDVILTY